MEVKLKNNCSKCNCLFELNSKSIEAIEAIVNGKKVYLLYFICTNCGSYYFVQADNDETLNLLNNEVKSLFIKVCILRRKGKKIPKSLNKKRKELNAKLSVMRKNLIDNCKNHQIEIDGKNIIIKFVTLNKDYRENHGI